MTKRIISGVLCLCMAFSVCLFSACGESNDETEGGQNSSTEGGNQEGGSQENGGNQEGDGNQDGDGNQGGAYVPVNADKYVRVNKNGVANATGQYLKFGNYPQREVTDETLKTALSAYQEALPTASESGTWTSYEYYQGTGEDDSQSNTTDYMWYKDVTHEGAKYRAVYFSSYRQCYTYKKFVDYQSENGYSTRTVYWFKYEPVKWKILSEGEDGKALLCADLILDSQDWNYTHCDRYIDNELVRGNYEHSSIRAWLNDDFYNWAFTAAEQSAIALSDIDNSATSAGGYAPTASKDTQDKVFLLSYVEASNTGYYQYSSNREKAPTAYAKVQGCKVTSGNAGWWLRSPYDVGVAVKTVTYSGSLTLSQEDVDKTYLGVSPSIRIVL